MVNSYKHIKIKKKRPKQKPTTGNICQLSDQCTLKGHLKNNGADAGYELKIWAPNGSKYTQN